MEMEKYEIINHLRQALLLERECYAVEEFIKMNERQRQTPKLLPVKPNIPKVQLAYQPPQPVFRDSARPVKAVDGDEVMDDVMTNYIWIPIVLAIIAGILGEVFLREAIGGIIMPFIICCGATLLLGVPITFGAVHENHATRHKNVHQSEQMRVMQEYHRSLEQHENLVENCQNAYHARVHEAAESHARSMRNYVLTLRETNAHNRGVEEANTMLDQIQQPLKAELAKIKRTLDRVYNLGYVYHKYRNIIAYASFLEYLDSGRCEDLEGAGGAYNIFETELRLDKITDKLDDVINNLLHIRQNQCYLFNAISEANQSIKQLTSCVNEGLYCITTAQGNLTYEVLQSHATTRNMSVQMNNYVSHLDNTNKEVLKYLENAKKVDQKLLEARK
jgi:hypothetical protein